MKQIEMYTSNSCPQCVKLKEYMKEKNISYVEYKIDKNEEARKELIRKGFMSVPLTIVDGQYVLGFDIRRLEELL